MKIIKKLKKKLFFKFLNYFKYELFTNYYDNMFIVLLNLKKRGYSPNIILDVGAYQGSWTEEVLKIYPFAKYIMFEAQQDKEIFLKDISTKNKNVAYHIDLLGNKIEKDKQFYLMKTGSSVLYENTDHNRETIKLDMNTIDNILSKQEIDDSCMLKIDVQGYELEVLKGAQETLKKVDLILLEVSILEYNENAPLIYEILHFMNNIGFITYDISSVRRTLNERALFQLDMFFSKKDSFLRKIKKFN